MKLAVMQPYFFPYLGYFQLISASDTFVFLDDVSYITGGWINRNRILIQGKAKYITIPCRKASQNKLISNVEHDLNDKKREKLSRKVKLAYKGAPFFEQIYPIYEDVLYSDFNSISALARKSVQNVLQYLEIEKTFKVNSEAFDNKTLKADQKILDLCEAVNATSYVNMEGGRDLYNKYSFLKHGVDLQFLKPWLPRYKQFSQEFIEGLSILDVLMFNSIDEIREMLNQYSFDS